MSVLSKLDELLCSIDLPVVLTPSQRKALVREIAATGGGALVVEPLPVTERWHSGECADLAGNCTTVNNAQVLGTYGGRVIVEDLFGDLRATN